MTVKKHYGFGFRDYRDFVLVTVCGQDCELVVGDIIVSVNGRRGESVSKDLLTPTGGVLEVISANSKRIRRLTIPAHHGSVVSPGVNEFAANFWAFQGLVGRVVNAEKFRQPDDLDRANQLLLRHRRTLAAHLRDALRESRALRAELNESQSRAAATALRLGEQISEKIAKIEAEHERVKAERDAFEQERNALQARLSQSDKSRREMVGSIERLAKQVRSRRVTHIRLGNELFRNRTGANA